MAKKQKDRFVTLDNGEVAKATFPIVVSASRSTDIPAFYADWFFHRLKKGYSAIEIISNNQSGSTYYHWCNINRNTYITANGKKYTMNRAEGIRIAPDKTYFTYAGQDITFTLYFPPLPESVTSISLIESIGSEWKFYGIKIR